MSATACQDWERRIAAGASLITAPPLFQAEADSAMAVFDLLRVVDAAGSPTMGEIARPWVREFAAAIFGAYDSEIGRRMMSEFFLLIAKKNGKSTVAAAIMLTALIRNWRHSAEFLILAPTIEVANNSYIPARDMVRTNESLNSLLAVQDHLRTITHRTTGATLKVVAADNETVGGKKATGVLVDELWLFGKRNNAENMLREACGGLASRPEGFVIYLSTQSDEAPAGVFAQKLNYARGVRDGRIKDEKFLPVIYEYPPAMLETKEYLKPDHFGITNPNLGLSVDEEFLERELRKAEDAGTDSLCGFLAKHLNVEIGVSLKSNNWTGALFWDECAEKGLTLDALLDRSEVVTVGIDGGGLDDMLGLCVIGRERDTGQWLHWAHAWAHPILLERHKGIATVLGDFKRKGELTIVNDIGEDVEAVADVIDQCEASGVLERIGVDPAGIGSIVDAIMTKGIAQERIVSIPQGWRMVGAIKTLERKLAEHGLSHCGSTLMGWCVGNAKVEPRGNAIIITKQAAGQGKIDALMATLDAITLMALNPASKKNKLLMFAVG